MKLELPFCYILYHHRAFGVDIQQIPLVMWERKILYEIRSKNPNDRYLIARTIGKQDFWKDESLAKEYLLNRWQSLIYSTFIFNKFFPGLPHIQPVGLGTVSSNYHRENEKGLRYCEEIEGRLPDHRWKWAVEKMKYVLENNLEVDENHILIFETQTYDESKKLLEKWAREFYALSLMDQFVKLFDKIMENPRLSPEAVKEILVSKRGIAFESGSKYFKRRIMRPDLDVRTKEDFINFKKTYPQFSLINPRFH